MAAVRGISHCYERPTYAGLAVLGLHHGPRALEGGVRRDPRQSIADEHDLHGADRATLYSSTEYKKIRLHYFTRRTTRAWEAASTRVAESAARPRYRARRSSTPARVGLLPGGVNSPVRAMRSIGRDHPIFIERGEGFELIDVDGNRYVDWVCSWGPLILGHARSGRGRGGRRRGGDGARATARRPRARSSSRPRSATAFASVEMVRMVNSGTEATMSAVRLARAATGREQVIKFAGAYHGHVDGLLAEAGSGLATQGIPASPGVPAAQAAATIVVPWNDLEAVERGARRARGRGDPRRAAAGEHGPGPAGRRASSRSCGGCADEHGALLVLDEVISGFRVARGGAQELLRRRGRPDDHGQGDRRRPAGRGLRRAPRADGAGRAGRRRLPGRDAVGKPARGRRRPGDAGAARRRRLRPARRSSPTGSRPGCERPPATVPVQVASVPGPRDPVLLRRAGARLRRRRARATSTPTAASAGRCSTAASTRPPRSSRPGSSRSPTTRRRSSAPARRPRRRSRRRFG